MYAHRVRPGSPHEIGIGSPSKLRTLDARFITRFIILYNLIFFFIKVYNKPLSYKGIISILL